MKIKVRADEGRSGRSVKVKRHGRRQEKPQQSKEPRRPSLEELRSEYDDEVALVADDTLREEEEKKK